MSKDWDESLVAVVQDDYLDNLVELMKKYSVINDEAYGYREDSDSIFKLGNLDSYNAKRLRILYFAVFNYYISAINTKMIRINNGEYPCLCIQYKDKHYALEKNHSITTCVKLDSREMDLINKDKIIRMSVVKNYFDDKDNAKIKILRNKKNYK